MSFSTVIKNILVIKRLHQPLLWQGIRLRRRGFPTVDTELALYEEDELDEEPVAYLDDRPNAASSQKKLTPSIERQLEKEKLKNIILRRKQLRESFPKEPLLITLAARTQIKHLHATEPSVWDIPTLARCFPLTEFSIAEILRSKKIPYDKEDLENIDRKVKKNWFKLKEEAMAYMEGKEVDPIYRRMIEDDERWSRIKNAAGIADLPVPQEYEIVKTLVDKAKKATPVAKRQFSSILDKCQPNTDRSTREEETPQYIGIDNNEAKALLENIVKIKDRGDYFEHNKRSKLSDIESNEGFLDHTTGQENVLERKEATTVSTNMREFISRQLGKENKSPRYSFLDRSDFQSEERKTDKRLKQNRDDRTVSVNSFFVDTDDRALCKSNANELIPTQRRQRNSFRNDRYDDRGEEYEASELKNHNESRNFNRRYLKEPNFDDSGLSGSLDDIYLVDGKLDKKHTQKKKMKKPR